MVGPVAAKADAVPRGIGESKLAQPPDTVWKEEVAAGGELEIDGSKG
jgi:hypothetical protein